MSQQCYTPKIIEQSLESIYSSKTGLSHDTAVELWLETIPSPVTRRNYAYKIKRFSRDSGLNPFSVNGFMLDEYLKQALSNKANVGSLRGQIVALNSLYKYAGEKDPSIDNPVKRISIKLPAHSDREIIKIRKRALSTELIHQVLEYFNNVEHRLGEEPPEAFLFRFLINTGMRISEALSLEYYDPRKEDGEYTNYLKISGNRGCIYVLGKGRRLREFYLNDAFTAYLLKHELCPGVKIIRNRKGTPLTSRGALFWMKKIEQKYFKGESIYKFCNHSLRHTYCTLQVQRDESPINIAKVVGNSAAMIEKVYMSEPKDINAGFSYI